MLQYYNDVICCSTECRDLLTRCLVRCPEKRITFADFFSHPFLELEYMPDENTFQKASILVTQVSVHFFIFIIIRLVRYAH